jgi:DNA-binding GntR family transcriptional regulator
MDDPSQLYPVDVANLRSHVAQQIRDAILNGAFLPGERLVELTIAKTLEVSRAPVREALAALEREGLVASIPRRGYFVIAFTDRDMEEIYSLRSILEIGAVRRAVERLTPQIISELQASVDALGEAIDQKRDYPTQASLDLAFHELICRAADQCRLYSAWDTTRMQTWLLIGLTSRTHVDRPSQPKVNHHRILKAMIAKDLPKVEKMLLEHFQDAQQRARRALHEFRHSQANQD